MNESEAERIAAAINVLRPDWPRSSLMTLMRKPGLVEKPRRDVCVALAWVACETNSATPGRVLEAGPWWKAAAVEEPSAHRRHPPRRDQECEHHPGQYADNCGGCRADEAAGTEKPQRQREAREDVRAAGIAACREALAGARRNP